MAWLVITKRGGSSSRRTVDSREEAMAVAGQWMSADRENTAIVAQFHQCQVCGMGAGLDPGFHEERYGHAPVVREAA